MSQDLFDSDSESASASQPIPGTLLQSVWDNEETSCYVDGTGDGTQYSDVAASQGLHFSTPFVEEFDPHATQNTFSQIQSHPDSPPTEIPRLKKITKKEASEMINKLVHITVVGDEIISQFIGGKIVDLDKIGDVEELERLKKIVMGRLYRLANKMKERKMRRYLNSDQLEATFFKDSEFEILQRSHFSFKEDSFLSGVMTNEGIEESIEAVVENNTEEVFEKNNSQADHKNKKSWKPLNQIKDIKWRGERSKNDFDQFINASENQNLEPAMLAGYFVQRHYYHKTGKEGINRKLSQLGSDLFKGDYSVLLRPKLSLEASLHLVERYDFGRTQYINANHFFSPYIQCIPYYLVSLHRRSITPALHPYPVGSDTTDARGIFVNLEEALKLHLLRLIQFDGDFIQNKCNNFKVKVHIGMDNAGDEKEYAQKSQLGLDTTHAENVSYCITSIHEDKPPEEENLTEQLVEKDPQNVSVEEEMECGFVRWDSSPQTHQKSAPCPWRTSDFFEEDGIRVFRKFDLELDEESTEGFTLTEAEKNHQLSMKSQVDQYEIETTQYENEFIQKELFDFYFHYEEDRNHFMDGKSYMLAKDYANAVGSLALACQSLSSQFGETASECAEAYFYYGKALLELGRMESGVLGNALEGIPESEAEEEASSNVESTEKMTDDEKEYVRVQVTEAIKENFKEHAKRINLLVGSHTKGNIVYDLEDGHQDQNDSEEIEKDKLSSEQPMEDEDLSNLQRAWEILELAKNIYSKRIATPMKFDTSTRMENVKKSCDVLLALGEVSIENENYSQAVEDLNSCLEKCKDKLPDDYRKIAETQFQLGVALSYQEQFDEAIKYLKNSHQVLTNYLEKIKADSFDGLVGEIDEIEKLLPQIREKIQDTINCKDEIHLPAIKKPAGFQEAGKMVWNEKNKSSVRSIRPWGRVFERENEATLRPLFQTVIEPQILSLTTVEHLNNIQSQEDIVHIKQEKNQDITEIRKSNIIKKNLEKNHQNPSKPLLFVSHEDGTVNSFSIYAQVKSGDGHLGETLTQRTGAGCYSCDANTEDIHDLRRVQQGFAMNFTSSDSQRVFEGLAKDHGISEEEWSSWAIPSKKNDWNERFGLKGQPISSQLELSRISGVLHTSKLRALSWLNNLVTRDSTVRKWGRGARYTECQKNNLDRCGDEWSRALGDLTGYRNKPMPNQLTGYMASRIFEESKREEIILAISDLSFWKTCRQRDMNHAEKNNYRILFQRLSVIQRVISSDRCIIILLFYKYLKETYIFILEVWPWALISDSIHRLLGHVWEHIVLNLNMGLASENEQGVECVNHKRREDREKRSRKMDLWSNLTDTMTHAWAGSDPGVRSFDRLPFCRLCQTQDHWTMGCPTKTAGPSDAAGDDDIVDSFFCEKSSEPEDQIDLLSRLFL